jgi:hypothetical protein
MGQPSVFDWINISVSSIASLSTAGALAVALILLARDRREKRNSKESADRARAEPVSAWASGAEILSPEREDLELGAVGAFNVRVHVRNAGPQPIYDVIVTMPTELDNDQEPLDLQFLPPGETSTGTVLHRTNPGGPAGGGLIGAALVDFTDARGQRWHRGANGLIERRPPITKGYWERVHDEGVRSDEWLAKWKKNPFDQSRF